MGRRLNLDGGTLNLDGRTLNLEGGTRPPYNLSTGSTLGEKSGAHGLSFVCFYQNSVRSACRLPSKQVAWD